MTHKIIRTVEDEPPAKRRWTLDKKDGLQRFQAACEERLPQEAPGRFCPRRRVDAVLRCQMFCECRKIGVLDAPDGNRLLGKRVDPVIARHDSPRIKEFANGEVEELRRRDAPLGNLGDAQWTEGRTSHSVPKISSRPKRVLGGKVSAG